MIPKSAFYGSPRQSTKTWARPAGRSMTGFDMGDHNRLLGDWVVSNVSQEVMLRAQLLTMRARSRQLARDDDYFKGFLKLAKRNVVGSGGFNYQADVMNENGEPDDEANEAIESAWAEQSKPENFTTTGQLSRADFERLALVTAIRDGEFLARRVRGYNLNPYSYALQPMEVDFIEETKNVARTPAGNRISMGVEFNRWDRPVSYWLRTVHPGETQIGLQNRPKSQPYPAGDFLHVFIHDWFGQSRGVPWVHAAGTRLHMLAGYDEAALEAARGAACKNTYFKQTPDADGKFTGDRMDASGNWLEDMSPGQKELLPVGIDPVAIDPAYPQTQHGDFTTCMLRAAATSLGTSYISLASDLTKVNFSSARVGILEEREEWMIIQAWLAIAAGGIVWSDWLKSALARQAIVTARGRPLPLAKYEKFNRVLINGRRWPYVDPAKDQTSHKIALELGLTSHSRILAQQSNASLEQILKERARDRRLAAKIGEPLPTALAPEPPASPPAPEPSAPDEAPED